MIKKSYKKACQPTINDGSRTRMQPLKKSALFCCNSAECNKEIVTSGIADPVIQCYTCDSRITGPQGCSIFNQSNPNVYKAGSSSHNEQCAVSSFSFLYSIERYKSLFVIVRQSLVKQEKIRLQKKLIPHLQFEHLFINVLVNQEQFLMVELLFMDESIVVQPICVIRKI